MSRAMMVAVPGIDVNAVDDLHRVVSDFDLMQRLCWTKGIRVAPESVYDAMLTKRMALERLTNLFAAQAELYLVVYAGHGREGSGDWMLGGGDLSFADLLAKWKFKNHLLVILDSCHSGCWASRAQALNCPILAVQASCGSAEEALDGVFLSAWCLIQQGQLDVQYALNHMKSLKRHPQMSVPSSSSGPLHLLRSFPLLGDTHAALIGDVAHPRKLKLEDLGAKQAFEERFRLMQVLETDPEDECFACVSRMINGIPARDLDFPLIVRALVEGLRITKSPKGLRALSLCCSKEDAWNAVRESDAVTIAARCCHAGISGGLEALCEMSSVEILHPLICTPRMIKLILVSPGEPRNKFFVLWNICRSSDLVRALVHYGGAELIASALDTEWGARLCWLLVIHHPEGASAIMSAEPSALDILRRCAQDEFLAVRTRSSDFSSDRSRRKSAVENDIKTDRGSVPSGRRSRRRSVSSENDVATHGGSVCTGTTHKYGAEDRNDVKADCAIKHTGTSKNSVMKNDVVAHRNSIHNGRRQSAVSVHEWYQRAAEQLAKSVQQKVKLQLE